MNVRPLVYSMRRARGTPRGQLSWEESEKRLGLAKTPCKNIHFGRTLDLLCAYSARESFHCCARDIRGESLSSCVRRPVHVHGRGSRTGTARRRNRRESRRRRAIVHVAKDVIVFAAVDQPVERNSIPPRVMDIDATQHRHPFRSFGMAQSPPIPSPFGWTVIFSVSAGPIPSTSPLPGEGDTDLETIGIAFLEKLRPLVSQLSITKSKFFLPMNPSFRS